MKQIFFNPAQLASLNLKADAEQSAVDTAFADLVAKAGKVDGLETQLAAEKKKLSDLNAATEAAAVQTVKDLFAEAVKATKCTQVLADLMANNLKGNVEEAKKAIAAMQPYQSIVSALKSDDASKHDGKTWDELDRSGGLENLKATAPETFKAMFKARWGREYTDA